MTRFLKLHIKTQLPLYILPIALLYLIFLPYQVPMLKSTDPNLQIRGYASVQRLTLLFAVWNRYLSERLLFYRGYYEVTEAAFGRQRRQLWFWCSLGWTVIWLGVYICVLLLLGHAQVQLPAVLATECAVIMAFTRFLIRRTRSAIAGAAIAAGYLFLCFLNFLPDILCVTVPGVLPEYAGLSWYLRQMVWFGVFYLMG